jgi:predicted nuclease of predicted toxin-antitoxin system
LKLLFDQNISPKIVKQISEDFPDSKQVRHVGLEDASDAQIFNYAKANGYAIVTFDADFVDLNVVRGMPPKIIWFKTGNLTTKAISALMKKSIRVIQDFLNLDDIGILEIIN